MAEGASSVMLETDVTALEEALYAQQKLLQKLNVEVEEERESSATAASEALSMIIRLQGEKASLKMEASQYKRMAEEKICHAEEALAIFEDLIYQREMEVASLEYQVQAYRYRLISMGCDDISIHENKFPENLLGQRSEFLFGDKAVNSNSWRLNSLPQALIKDPNHKKSVLDRIRASHPGLESLWSPMDDILIQEVDESEKRLGSFAAKESLDLSTYWEHIRKWDERVKETTGSKDSGRNRTTTTLLKGGSWSPSEFSQVNAYIDSITEVNVTTSDQVKNAESLQERQDIIDSPCSSSVHDVFEVPESKETRSAFESWKKTHCKLTLEPEVRLGKLELAAEDALKSPSTIEAEKVKAMLISASQDRKLNKTRNAANLARCISPVLPAANSPIEYQQLNWRVERLERARNNTKQEISGEGGGEEVLSILKELRERLNSIDSEMKSWKATKSYFPDEPSLDPLQEAMLYFWI
ncbi:uncharacterized protein LOC105633547 [Jatropha curcas]|uniref:uncharacterized protein LOC105633547 n=1 Tax=Jatropha curcas TaxID=180498 RepID=UPI0005FB549B|nr:uncharacterized protein LOC105633547 [Jatropha curcas]